MLCTWLHFVWSVNLHKKHLSDYINYSSPPKLTNHQEKIQRLEQIVSGGKIPKGVGTTGKWPQGVDLCHTLTDALWTIVSKTLFHPSPLSLLHTCGIFWKLCGWLFSQQVDVSAQSTPQLTSRLSGSSVQLHIRNWWALLQLQWSISLGFAPPLSWISCFLYK